MKRFSILLIICLSLTGCGGKKEPGKTKVEQSPPTVSLNSANKLLSMKRCKEAIHAYQAFLDKYPKDAGAWNLLGLAYLCDSRVDQAFIAFNQALALSPTYTDVHNNLGVAHTEAGKYAEARAEFLKALDDPGYPKAGPYFNLARLAFVQGNYEESRALARKAIEFVPKENGLPKETAPVLLYSISLERLNRFDEAEASYNDVLKVDPNSLEGNFGMANVLMKKNQPCVARLYYQKVVDADPLSDKGQRSLAALKNIQCQN